MAIPNSLKRLKIGIIGCGNMGQSMVRGLVENSFYPQNIYASDADARRLKALKKDVNVRIGKTNRQTASSADVLILATKPHVIDAVLDEISLCVPKTTLVISIAAGIPIARIQKGIKEKVAIVRVMPNMPALIGEGVSAYAMGPRTLAKHGTMTEQILKSLGQVVEVKERMIDAVTAISGSGPAYFFLMVEKLIESAYEHGLKLQTARQLVYQTALGSAKVLLSENTDPDEMIKRVASKGGTTEAALKVFQKKGFGKIVQDAVHAAFKRAKELSES